MFPSSRLVLGTVQLGLTYGIANKNGKPDADMAVSIVKTAYEKGIREFDTAQAYGESEAILGKAFRELGIASDVKVTTKLDPKLPWSDEGFLVRSVEESLKRLGVEQLEALLLHREEMMDTLENGFTGALEQIRRKGYTRGLGVSVYSPERARQALDLDLFQVVHLPTSILDRRFRDSGIFEFGRKRGKEIYVRSAFLQGLLLMDADDVPAGLKGVVGVLEEIDRIASRYRLTRSSIALIYLRDRFRDAKVIFGAETVDQVRQNAEEWRIDVPGSLLEEIERLEPELDDSVLNPSRWLH